MSKIEVPKLTEAQIADLQRRYAELVDGHEADLQQRYVTGQPLRVNGNASVIDAISRETGLGYPVVWFYTVNEANVEHFEPGGPCHCGAKHYAKGLCQRHYVQLKRECYRERRLAALAGAA